MIRYQEYQPSAFLATVVRCYWTLEGRNDTPAFENVLPDGSSEIIFHLADSFVVDECGLEKGQPGALAFGQITKFISLKPGTQIETIGIKLTASGLYALTGIPQAALKNSWFPLEDLLTDSHEAAELLRDKHEWLARQEVIEQWLLRSLGKSAKYIKHTTPVQHAVREIIGKGGSDTVRKLTRELGISERQLERKFREVAGLSPKVFSRIIKFQNLLKQRAKFSSLAELSLEFGYYDTSHFVKEFREFTGTNPSDLFLLPEESLTKVFIAK